MSKRQEEVIDMEPVMDELDLAVDGSTPVEVALNKHFTYISRVRFVLGFTDAACEYTEFLAGGALANGFVVKFDGEAFSPTITTKAEMAKLGKFYVSPKDEDAATESYVFEAILDFTAYMPMGVYMYDSTNSYRAFTVRIQDDLSSGTDFFVAIVEGWTIKV